MLLYFQHLGFYIISSISFDLSNLIRSILCFFYILQDQMLYLHIFSQGLNFSQEDLFRQEVNFSMAPYLLLFCFFILSICFHLLALCNHELNNSAALYFCQLALMCLLVLLEHGFQYLNILFFILDLKVYTLLKLFLNLSFF